MIITIIKSMFPYIESMFAHIDMLPMKISNVILFKFMFSALSRFSKLLCVT